jgi:DNA-binding MarR family transcriptional regulator
MAAAGWVERRAHPLDRRALQLYLTPKSQPILEEMHARAADTLADAFSGMPANAQKQLIDALQVVKHNLAAAETASTATQSSTRTNTDARRQAAKPRRPR